MQPLQFQCTLSVVHLFCIMPICTRHDVWSFFNDQDCKYPLKKLKLYWNNLLVMKVCPSLLPCTSIDLNFHLSDIVFLLPLQTAQLCWSASGSEGGRKRSTLLRRLAPNTMTLAFSSWMTPMELESETWNLSTTKMPSGSTRRSSKSGLLGGERNQWAGKHWLRCYVTLDFVL